MRSRFTLHALRKARQAGISIVQLREVVDGDDICETMPTPADDRTGKRVYGRIGMTEVHVVLVVNPGDTHLTVTTVYEVDRTDFPDGRTRRRDR